VSLPPDTERIHFRKYTLDDLDDVTAMFSDSQARRFYPEMDNSENNRRWIEWNLRNYEEHGFGLWVIEDRTSGEFFGDCGISYQPVEAEEILEIGYHLVAAHRGKGLVTEAARACLAFGFEVVGAEMLCSLVHPENEASVRVATRLHDHHRTYLKRPDGSKRLIFWTELRPTGL
jgi:RimJ/RimL family protein N-acetyltransferase